MNLKNLTFCIVIFSFTSFFSQKSIDYIYLIDSTRIRKHVEILANDSLQGRNTGEIGQKKAAKYLAQEFRKLKIDSFSTNYFQTFYLSRKIEEGSLQINNIKLKLIQDFGSLNDFNLIQQKTSGVKHYTYENFVKLKIKNEQTLIISTNSLKEVDMNLIKNSGIKIVYLLIKNYDSKLFLENSLKTNNDKLNHQHIIYVNADKIKKLKTKNKINLNLHLQDKNCPSTENVIGFIPGYDSILKNEFVVVSAHYDHLGTNKKGEVYNGADDNASGTAALLELARIFKELEKQNKQTKRSILFIFFTGEEHGLLGSDYYSKHPFIPLNKTIADFNIDMIGFKDSLNEKSQFSVYIIGSDRINQNFHNTHESIAKKHNSLKLDYTYNQTSNKERLYYRSDHYNFAKNGIPSIFYFGGFHEHYHKTTDDIENLSFSKINTITELVFMTVYEIANNGY